MRWDPIDASSVFLEPGQLLAAAGLRQGELLVFVNRPDGKSRALANESARAVSNASSVPKGGQLALRARAASPTSGAASASTGAMVATTPAMSQNS